MRNKKDFLLIAIIVILLSDAKNEILLGKPNAETTQNNNWIKQKVFTNKKRQIAIITKA